MQACLINKTENRVPKNKEAIETGYRHTNVRNSNKTDPKSFAQLASITS